MKRRSQKIEEVQNDVFQTESSEYSQEQSSSSDAIESALQSMKFRRNRGQNMKKLIQKKQQEEESDDFWKENDYFGKQEDLSLDDSEEFNSKSEEDMSDEFDSDFNQTSSESSEESSESLQNEKTKKKQQIINKKIGKKSPTNQKQTKFDQKSHLQQRSQQLAKSKALLLKKKRERRELKKQKEKENPNYVEKLYFIHENFSPEQLLKEAVKTEFANKRSLEELIRIEEDRKYKVSFKKVQITNPKIMTSSSNKPEENFVYFSDNITYNRTIGQALYLREQELKEIQKEEQMEIENNEDTIQLGQSKTQGKYCHPKTKERYNTIQEFQELEKNYQNQELQQKKQQLKLLQQLKEQKEHQYSKIKQ